jgi:hypothetical protein
MSPSERLLGDRCWVIGNGPSLRGFDFRRLNGQAVLGMNAAYRYWQEINWYPTFYCCLDDELVATHWRQIIDLVRSGRVKKAFVSGSLAEYDPSVLGDERFVLLDQFIDYWYRMRGKANGLHFYDSTFFASSQPSKLTTGSHSVRFAAHLGYKEICLLGIDLRYVETIPEAEQVGEIALRIRETPKHNPNYFFDGYQQAGDRYNIPNPKSHLGDLHFASLRVVRDDFAGLREAPRVVNCNAASRLFDERLFPYLHVDRAINDRPLSSVVVPTTLKERDALLNQMWLFQQDAFSPDPVEDFQKPDLAYVFNSGDTSSLEEELRQSFNGSDRLKQAFREPIFVNLGLSGERDQYIRDYTKPAGRFGYKAGPNNQFFETLGRFALSGHFMFLMESDCLPIRRGWLGKLQNLLRNSERFWILGSGYRGKATIDESYKLHINGNAIYAAGDLEFQVFVESFWQPELERLVSANPLIAYDCALEMLIGEASSRSPGNPTWRLTQEIMHLLRYSDFIQNRSGNADFWDTPQDLVRYLNRDSVETCFLHGKPIAEAVAAMRKNGDAPDPYALKMPRLAPPTMVGAPKVNGQLIPSPQSSADKAFSEQEFPRLLLLDNGLGTRAGESCELMSSLLARWPGDRLLHVCCGPGDLVQSRSDGAVIAVNLVIAEQRSALKVSITEFLPSLILYRVVPNASQMHELAMEVIHEHDAPLISCVADDWPVALIEREGPELGGIDADCRSLFRQSAGLLCKGEALGQALRRRYGISFEPFSVGIDLHKWPTKPKSPTEAVLIRYVGLLSAESAVQSLEAVARVVEQLGDGGADICLQIHAEANTADTEGYRFTGFRHTSLTSGDLSTDACREWLCAADIVLLTYGFDEESRKLARYTISPRLPELLCSGAALFVIGPPDVATIDLLTALDCSRICAEDAQTSIATALHDLVGSQNQRLELSRRAIAIARNRFGVHRLRERFTKWALEVAGASQTDLALKIVRQSERRRWLISHAGPDNGVATTKPSYANAQLPAITPHLPKPTFDSAPSRPRRPSTIELPKVLLLDLTRIGDATATGELKGSLFRDWTSDRIFQVFGGGQPGLGTLVNGEIGKTDVTGAGLRDQLKARIASFEPDVIIYRPVPDTAYLHSLAMEVVSDHNLPLVTWIMDDWPAALKLRDPEQFEMVDKDLRSLFNKSIGALSIGSAMSSAFSERYGLDFEPFANGIERADWDWSGSRAPSKSVLIRYSGSLAHEMGLESLRSVALAVEALSGEGVDITFEIKTRKYWADRAGASFSGFSRTRISTEELSPSDYRKWLSGADIVLICYNFDDASKAYVRYSVANKLPECLASGAALMAVGPADIAMMGLLRSLDCSVLVETPDLATLTRELGDLAGSPEKREVLAQRAREVAYERFDMLQTRRRFVRWLTNAVQADATGKIVHSKTNFARDLQRLQTWTRGGTISRDREWRSGQSEKLEQLSKKFDGIASSLQSRFPQKAG